MAQQIDFAVIAQLRGMDTGTDSTLFADLVGMFTMRAPQRMEEISAAITRLDLQKVSFLAHNLKSSCGTLGLRRMQDIARRMEETSREGNTQDINGQHLVEMLAELWGEYQSVEPLLKG